jgi:hypothetical protein
MNIEPEQELDLDLGKARNRGTHKGGVLLVQSKFVCHSILFTRKLCH